MQMWSTMWVIRSVVAVLLIYLLYGFVINTVKPLHEGHLGDREKLLFWRGGHYGGGGGMDLIQRLFLGTDNMIVLSSCLLYPLVEIQS